MREYANYQASHIRRSSRAIDAARPLVLGQYLDDDEVFERIAEVVRLYVRLIALIGRIDDHAERVFAFVHEHTMSERERDGG